MIPSSLFRLSFGLPGALVCSERMSADKGKPREREKGSSCSTEGGGSGSSKKRRKERKEEERKKAITHQHVQVLPTECVLMNN